METCSGDTLLSTWMSGETRRWHCNPVMAGQGQTIADHQGRCAQLLLQLFPQAGPSLIWAVLHHDVGEALAGDLPRPFKEFHPAIAADHAEVEGHLAARIVGRSMPFLTERETAMLQFVDQLEAALFVAFRVPKEIHRYQSGWPGALADLFAQAESLGVLAPVKVALSRLKRGDY